MQKTRLLFVIKSLGVGGTEDELVKIANALNPREFELKIIVCRKTKALYSRIKNKRSVMFCKQGGLDSFLGKLSFIKKASLAGRIQNNIINLFFIPKVR